MQKVLFIKKKCKDSSLLSRRGSWGLFSSLYNGEPFKQNISIGMKKKRFVFFRVSTTIERANHNGEQKGKELQMMREILMALSSFNFHHSRPPPERPSTTFCPQVLCIETSISSVQLFFFKERFLLMEESSYLLMGVSCFPYPTKKTQRIKGARGRIS